MTEAFIRKAASSSRLIHECDDFLVQHAEGEGERCWVTFTSAYGDKPFAKNFIRRRGEEACLVLAKRPHVYQTAKLWRMLDAVDAHLSKDGRWALGSSPAASLRSLSPVVSASSPRSRRRRSSASIRRS